MKLLVIYEDNWADEMDVQGFAVWEADAWAVYQQRVRDADFIIWSEFEIGIGTNETVSFDDAEDYLAHFREVTITDEEATRLLELFNPEDVLTTSYAQWGETAYIDLDDEDSFDF